MSKSERGKQMRNPERIYEIITVLIEAWKTVPDWRFGQLIENIKAHIGKDDLFYVTDTELEIAIIEYFNLDLKI